MGAAVDRSLGLARLYARAILEVAEERGEAELLDDELRQVATLVAADGELRRMLASPLVEPERRRASLETAFRGRASDLLTDALQVMNRKGRLAFLPEIAEAYHHELEMLRGRVEVEVRSAVELDEEQRDRLREVLGKRTGREAVLEERVEPRLIGGLVVQVGDRKLDLSVARALEKIGHAMAARGRREIARGETFLAE